MSAKLISMTAKLISMAIEQFKWTIFWRLNWSQSRIRKWSNIDFYFDKRPIFHTARPKNQLFGLDTISKPIISIRVLFWNDFNPKCCIFFDLEIESFLKAKSFFFSHFQFWKNDSSWFWLWNDQDIRCRNQSCLLHWWISWMIRNGW